LLMGNKNKEQLKAQIVYLHPIGIWVNYRWAIQPESKWGRHNSVSYEANPSCIHPVSTHIFPNKKSSSVKLKWCGGKTCNAASLQRVNNKEDLNMTPTTVHIIEFVPQIVRMSCLMISLSIQQ
jgi:hypothetical protein